MKGMAKKIVLPVANTISISARLLLHKARRGRAKQAAASRPRPTSPGRCRQSPATASCSRPHREPCFTLTGGCTGHRQHRARCRNARRCGLSWGVCTSFVRLRNQSYAISARPIKWP
jgi:hypothetical protein